MRYKVRIFYPGSKQIQMTNQSRWVSPKSFDFASTFTKVVEEAIVNKTSVEQIALISSLWNRMHKNMKL